jgi:aminotransferase
MTGLTRRTAGISQRARATVISPIKEMALLAQQIGGCVSLGWGLPSFETPLHIREAARQALATDADIGKYPHIRGIPQLRGALAARLSEQAGRAVDPEREILVTVGAQQAIFSSLQTIVDPGDEVILLSPCFSSYIDQVIFAGGVPRFVSLREDDGWRMPIDDVRRAIGPKTKAIILNSPVNPTGSIYQADDLRCVAELACEKDFFVLTDDTYSFLVFDDAKTSSMLSIPEMKDRLIACFTFSKEYAMSGWRIGYLYADGGLVDEIMKVHDASVITAPRVCQAAALAALDGPQDCVQQFVDELSRRRALMCARLDRLSEFFAYIPPAGSYYMFPRLKMPDVDSFAFAITMLREARVVIVPGDAFGPAGAGYVRLCFGVDELAITEAFDRIDRFLFA